MSDAPDALPSAAPGAGAGAEKKPSRKSTKSAASGAGGSHQRQRPIIMAMISTPGPAAYGLRSTIGSNRKADPSKRRAPSHSFGSRTRQQSSSCTPGPGSYNLQVTNRGKAKMPAYSISARTQEVFGNVDNGTPGPGVYRPLNTTPRARTAPSWSIGSREPAPRESPNPGPAAYTLPATVGTRQLIGQSAAAVSIRSQPRSLPPPHVPGPNAYSAPSTNTCKKSAPAFTFRPKIEHLAMPKTSNMDNPGPNQYNPQSAKGSRTPGFSMRTRHSEYALSPGENLDALVAAKLK